ncbi:MAG: AMP-binding protein [Thermomicrobiales bacterium]|nr:AMP-binding protein [Thermomicrobiales bacterium]
MLGVPLLVGYGMTEALGYATAEGVPEAAPRRLGSVGRAWPEVEIAIRDEARQPLADGEIGEACPVYAFPGDPPFPTRAAPEGRAMVATMQEVQPAGPYRLLGACVGGVFTWEMACQREAAGETVDLMLIDTRNPRLQIDEGDFRQAAATARTPDERRAWRRERQAARRRRGEAPRACRGAAHGAAASACRVMISRAYDPRPFGGRVHLLVNAEWHRTSPMLGWNGLLDDRLQVAVLPGRHGIDWDIPGVADWLGQTLRQRWLAMCPRGWYGKRSAWISVLPTPRCRPRCRPAACAQPGAAPTTCSGRPPPPPAPARCAPPPGSASAAGTRARRTRRSGPASRASRRTPRRAGRGRRGSAPPATARRRGRDRADRWRRR